MFGCIFIFEKRLRFILETFGIWFLFKRFSFLFLDRLCLLFLRCLLALFICLFIWCFLNFDFKGRTLMLFRLVLRTESTSFVLTDRRRIWLSLTSLYVKFFLESWVALQIRIYFFFYHFLLLVIRRCIDFVCNVSIVIPWKDLTLRFLCFNP